MFEKTKNGFFAAPNMILVGISLGLLFWLIDPCIDYFLLGRGKLPHDIFSPSSDEIWFRSFVSFIFIVFGFYVESISTRQKRAEKRLAQTVAMQKAAFESAADGLLVVDENRNVVEYNQKFLNLWGLTADEMKGGDPKVTVKKMLSLLKNPNAQKERIKTLYDNKLTDTYDILELTDGRIFEQFSIAQKIDNEIIGRVWSYRDITQKKLGEEALRQNEKRFRAIADYTYDWENWVGPDNKLIWVNPAVERITGYSIRECMEMPDYPLPLVHKDDRELIKDALSKAAQGVCGNDLPFRIRRKDGGVVWVAVSWQPIYDDHGQNLGHRSTVRDISARKKWEEALAESEKSYRTLAENLPGIVYRQPLGNKAPTQFFNNMVRNLTGYQMSELPSAEFCSLESIILEEDREAVKESLSGAVANGFAFMHEYRIRHRDGRIRYFVERGVPVYDASGKPLHIDGVIFDMTDQKQAQTQIEDNEKFLNTIFHGIQDGICVLDKNLNIIRVNSAMERWYAHQMPLIGKKCFISFQGRDRACEICPTIRAFETLKPQMDEVPLTGPNGVEGWIELHAFPLIDQSGETIGVVEYVRNITDRKKAEQSLRESEEKFRVLSEQNMLGIMIIQDDILKYVNNPVAQVLGKTPETLTGSSVKEIMPFIHPEDRQFAQEQLAKKQRGETDVVQHYKYRLVLPDQGTMWVEQFSKSIQYGGRWADLVTIVDITENYRALNALKDSEERYRKLVDSVSDYIYTLSFLNGRPVVSNHGPGCATVTGYSPDEFERDPQLWSRIIHDDDRNMIQVYLEKM
ncbi:MAG: PAS domain S-box protein, partial [Candidatus Zixiibacteriota bacterium]